MGKKEKKERRKDKKKHHKKKERRRDSGGSSEDSGGDSRSRSPSRDAKKAHKSEKHTHSKQPKRQQSVFGYTDADNPYGDANLTTTFVWRKKYEKEIAQGLNPKKLTKERMRTERERLREEIDKLKERRTKREREREENEALREYVERIKNAECDEDWEEKEEVFHTQQARLRSEIRIREGREQPIDLLVKNMLILKQKQEEEQEETDVVPTNMELELTEPYHVFVGLSEGELRTLRRDIDHYLQLGENVPYWQALLTVCDDEISKASEEKQRQLQLQLQLQQAVATGGDMLPPYPQDALPEAVRQEVRRLLEGKSIEELDELEAETVRTIASAGQPGQPAVDVEYWEAVRRQIAVFRSKAYLRAFHADLLRQHLQQLKESQVRQQALGEGEDIMDTRVKDEEGTAEAAEATEVADKNGAEPEEDFEPPLIPFGDDSMEIVDPEEDAAQLEAQRKHVLEEKRQQLELLAAHRPAAGAAGSERVDEGYVHGALEAAGMQRFATQDDAMYEREASKPMDPDEEIFAVEQEVSTSASAYWWHDKYRPRKPRYFNRVKTGFDWHKYNQAHYDKENPPPKVVQGYKFNIFYPDLIDPTKPPQYKITPDPEGNPDYCIIRFVAGPPYEDLAFKIVRKPWQFSHKHGFRCVFDRGVLMLYFNFKKFFYRR